MKIFCHILCPLLLILGCSSIVYAFNPTHLERFLKTNHCAKCDLRKADLSNKKFVFADLYKANLKGAIFKNSDLTRATLRGANLTDTDFSEAILYNADLNMTKMIRTNFTSADCRKMLYYKATKIDVVSDNANFEGAYNTEGKKCDYGDGGCWQLHF